MSKKKFRVLYWREARLYDKDWNAWKDPGVFEGAEAAVRAEIWKKKILFDGNYHQNGEFGCPVVKCPDGKIRGFVVSFRKWAEILATVYLGDPKSYIRFLNFREDEEEDRFKGLYIQKLRKALSRAISCYGHQGGPWNVPGEPGSWIAQAREAYNYGITDYIRSPAFNRRKHARHAVDCQ